MDLEKEKAYAPAALTAGSSLFTNERRQQIAHILGEQQRVTVPALSQLFSVSEVTIRKDLAWLEAHHFAVRTHGGAVLATSHSLEMGFDTREKLQHNEKERIGAAAASYVLDGETIALDASTTALAMTQYLKAKRELTVVTNGLRIGMELINTPGISVLIPGGMLRHESFSLIGTWGKSVLQQVHISKAFVGARGFSPIEGLTDVNGEEVELKRAIVEAAKEVIAIVDHSKWGHLAFATFCPLERLKLIITDAKAPADMVEQVRSQGIEVWIA
ncbi:DeoR/GlpR family DNA-binding transcription regulator [Dictyobacter aurantiacus]|uniref:DeoR family transcriptional regulator n=1 Tax=Dictyobacter aurantiacus TaxID=1936993 RepID=A0A401Z781_9CHLR|nr:DeoR/GlpR family DNA-binding transcription regulator [Dictyobacter aurantiacus]GCE02711.1 DeoR family transcriptional regulator [Dictyobacter aurantiacus]